MSCCSSCIARKDAKPYNNMHLEYLSLKEGCTDSSGSTLVKMPHCWKSHVMAQLMLDIGFSMEINGWCIELSFVDTFFFLV